MIQIKPTPLLPATQETFGWTKDSAIDVDGQPFSLRDVNPPMDLLSGKALTPEQAKANPHNVSHNFRNCMNCVVALNATLRGSPTVATLVSYTKSPSLEEAMNAWLQNGIDASLFKEMTIADVVHCMTNAGDGATGVIGTGGKPGVPGHVFNVYNQEGVIRFLDGQVGCERNGAPTTVVQFILLP